MSGFLDGLREHHQRHKDQREERHEARHDRHDHGAGYSDDNSGSNHHGQRHQHEDRDDERRRPQSYESQLRDQGYGHGHPSGPPPSGRGPHAPASQSNFDRGDFASDADVDRMIARGEFDRKQRSEERGHGRGYGYGGAGEERGNAYSRYDAPSGPPPGQGYGERANDYGRFDAPTGPPPGRSYQTEQPHRQGYESGGAYATGYSGGPDHQNQYGSQQTQGRPQYEAPQGLPLGHGGGRGNVPSGGSVTSRDGEERYGSSYSGPPGDRSEPPRRGEAAGYYNQQGPSGPGDRYAHLSDLAQGDDDPELYRRATQGLGERIQTQAQSRRPRRDDNEEEDYKAHVDAHKKAYGGDGHGPMDADSIGTAAAMEAFKQTAAAAGPNAPAGAFQASKASGDFSSKPAAREEEEEDTTAARAGGSGGLQDKLMALAMSQAGKLFDKKNTGGGAKPEDKAQAMQSAAATAMQLFTQYQGKGKLESSDMSKVMGLAMKLL